MGDLPFDEKEALNSTEADIDFIKDVLNDLMKEADESEGEMEYALTQAKIDFETVRKAAHRIKGSTSYLSCKPLCKVSEELQNKAHDCEKYAPADAPEADVTYLFELFECYKERLGALKAYLVENGYLTL